MKNKLLRLSMCVEGKVFEFLSYNSYFVASHINIAKAGKNLEEALVAYGVPFTSHVAAKKVGS